MYHCKSRMRDSPRPFPGVSRAARCVEQQNVPEGRIIPLDHTPNRGQRTQLLLWRRGEPRIELGTSSNIVSVRNGDRPDMSCEGGDSQAPDRDLVAGLTHLSLTQISTLLHLSTRLSVNQSLCDLFIHRARPKPPVHMPLWWYPKTKAHPKLTTTATPATSVDVIEEDGSDA